MIATMAMTATSAMTVVTAKMATMMPNSNNARK